ncbi:gamma tubulin complex Spc97/GCP2 subunit Alp4, partial [Kickxella alabastrina]
MRTFERLVHLISAIQEKDLPLPTQPVVEKSQLEDDGFMSSVGDGMAPDEEVADFVDNGMPNSEPESVDYEDEVVDEVYDLEIFPEERFVVRGGFTLNVISDMIRMRGGDQSTRQLYEFLLTKASVPFIKMLEHWLSTGELESNRLDMAGEFMVVRDSDAVGVRVFLDTDGAEDFGGKSILPISNGLSFMSVPDLTPEYLRPFSEKIVRTGEYLNTLRSYGIDLRTLEHKSSPAGAFSAGSDSSGGLDTLGCSLDGLLNPQTLMREIDQAYLRANQALLDILFKDGKMMTYLGAVKHYLLFEKSDFLTHFLDLAKVEISREPKDMSANRLQSFLDLALLNPASVSHDDPLKDIVKVTLESVDLIDTLKMISLAELKKPTEMPSTTHRPIRETYAAGATFLGTSILSDNFLSGDVSLGLQLQIPFPLDIVLDRPTMNKYRAMSRLLLMLKQTEQNLVASWMTNLKLDDPRFILPGSSAASSSARAQNIKDVKTEAQLRALFLNIHTMRHRILICIQQILYYCFWDVIEP